MIKEPLPDLSSEVLAELIYGKIRKSEGMKTPNYKVTPEVILRIEGLFHQSVNTRGLVTTHKPKAFEMWLTGYLSDTNVDAMETIKALKKSKSKVAGAIARKVLKDRYDIDHQFTMALWALIISGISMVANVLIAIFK